MNRFEISIVVPCFNEEKVIASNMDILFHHLELHFSSFEIICVDDGSSDRTFESLTSLSLPEDRFKVFKNKNNRGKGYSVRYGVLHSSGDIILFMDADLSTDLREIVRIYKMTVEDYDLVIGSRHSKDSNISVSQPLHRRLSAFAFRTISNTAIGLDFKDTQCGFKSFRRQAALEIFSSQKIERFAFDVEILYLAELFGFSIGVLPVRWANASDSRVKFFRDSMNMLKDIHRIKKLHTK